MSCKIIIHTIFLPNASLDDENLFIDWSRSDIALLTIPAPTIPSDIIISFKRIENKLLNRMQMILNLFFLF